MACDETCAEGNEQTLTVAIVDETDPPTATLSVVSSSVNEKTSPTGTDVKVTLSAVSAKNVTVTLSVAGTAASGVDYTLPLTIAIPAGSVSGSVTLAVNDDLLDEEDEAVVIDIASVVNSTELGAQTQTVTLVDETPLPKVTLSVGASEAVSYTHLTLPTTPYV